MLPRAKLKEGSAPRFGLRVDEPGQAQVRPTSERVIVATGRYLGEGFDDSRLDTLFLTMPIAWKGTLAQYAGRLHRLHDAKREVIIYDYIDMSVPVLARMAAKRRVGYQTIGYRILGTGDLFSDQSVASNVSGVRNFLRLSRISSVLGRGSLAGSTPSVGQRTGPAHNFSGSSSAIRPIPTDERAVQSKFLHLLRDFSQ